MKGLYKKISVGVLALALVLGGSLSQGAMAYADSESERCQDEIDKCQYEIDKPQKPSGSSWDDEFEEDRNNSFVMDYQNKYGYKFLGVSQEDPKPGDQNYYLKKYFRDRWDFIDCMENHVKNHKHGGIRIYNIGGKFFKIEFEKISSK